MICFMLIFSSNEFQIRRLDLNFNILVFLESPKTDFSPSIIYNLFFTSDHMNSLSIYTKLPIFPTERFMKVKRFSVYYQQQLILAILYCWLQSITCAQYQGWVGFQNLHEIIARFFLHFGFLPDTSLLGTYIVCQCGQESYFCSVLLPTSWGKPLIEDLLSLFLLFKLQLQYYFAFLSDIKMIWI